MNHMDMPAGRLFNENYNEEGNCGGILRGSSDDDIGEIVSDEAVNPLDVLAAHGINTDNLDDDMTFDEFSDNYPDIWTYCLTDLMECLMNCRCVVLVRFMTSDQENDVYRFAEVPAPLE